QRQRREGGDDRRDQGQGRRHGRRRRRGGRHRLAGISPPNGEIRRMRRFRTPLLALSAVAVLGGSLANLALAGGGKDTTPQGWTIAPAGRQADVMRFPLGLAANADGSKILVT